MSEPISPGDLVECVQNRLATTLPPRGLVVGRIYRVTAVGVTPPDDVSPNVPWVRVAGAPCREDKWGFRAVWFRPVGKPASEIIAALQRPTERARELVDVGSATPSEEG